MTHIKSSTNVISIEHAVSAVFVAVFLWLVLTLRGRNNLIPLVKSLIIVLYLQISTRKIKFSSKSQATGLFFKYSRKNFVNVSLDILRKYLNNRPQVIMIYRLINYLGCWKHTRRIRKSRAASE